MGQQRYAPDELNEFLDALGECLEEPATVVLVGSSAIILGHGVTTTTIDIDTLHPCPPALQIAIQQARRVTGLAVPVGPPGVVQMPEGFEDRLVRLKTRGQLELFILEKHDLAISKMLRAVEHDRQHVQALHRRDPLDLETLVERFERDMLPCYVGDPATVIDYFLWMIEELFGEMASVRTARRLKRLR